MLRENINAMRKEDEIKVKRNTLVEKGRANRDDEGIRKIAT